MPSTRKRQAPGQLPRRSSRPRRHSSRLPGATPEAPSVLPVDPIPVVQTPANNPANQPVPGTAPASNLPPDLVQHIAAEVSRAVAAALQTVLPRTLHPAPILPGPVPTPTPQVQGALIPAPLVATGHVGGVDAAVQGSVASALQALSGEGSLGVSQAESRPPSIFNSMSVPLDARLDAKIKTKIWSNEYFDFGQLLHSIPTDNKYRISISDTQGNATPSLCLEPTRKAKVITTIEEWTGAFQVFVGVYTSKFPHEAPALMKYSEVVRDLASRSGDWKFYDTNFRYIRQQNPAGMSWGAPHWELWIRAQHFSQSLKKPNFPKPPPSNTIVPRGYCRKFHTGAACSGCTYKHECHKCGTIHPAHRCNFRAQRFQGAKPSTAPKYSDAGPRAPNTNQGK